MIVQLLVLSYLIVGPSPAITAQADEPTVTCAVVKNTLDDLKTELPQDAQFPDELSPATTQTIRDLTAQLPQLATDSVQSAECYQPLADTKDLRLEWSSFLLRLYARAADKTAAADYLAWAKALASSAIAAPAPAACEKALQLIRDGDLDTADALLTDIEASGAEETKECSSQARNTLAISAIDRQDPLSVTERWSTSAAPGLLNLASWLLGAFLIGLLALRALIALHFPQSAGRRVLWAVIGVVGLAGVITLICWRPINYPWTYPALVVAFAAGMAVSMMLHLRNRLKISTVDADSDAKIPAGFSQAVAAELAAIGTRGPRGVDVTTGPDTTTTVADSIGVLPGSSFLKALTTIWAAISPTTDWRLEGAVSSKEAGEIQVAVTLRQGRKVVASRVVNSRLFDGLDEAGKTVSGGAWANMVTAIATWTYWQLGPEAELLDHDPAAARRPTDLRLYGARRWESIALQTVASRSRDDRSQDAGDALAKQLLNRALELDPENRACLFSLLSIRLRNAALSDAGELESHLRLINDLVALQGDVGEGTPLRWRIDYAIGSALLNHLAALTFTPAAPRPTKELETQWLQPAPPGVLATLASAAHPDKPQDLPLRNQLQVLAQGAMIAARSMSRCNPDQAMHITSPREAFNVCCGKLITWDPAKVRANNPSGMSLTDNPDAVAPWIDRFSTDSRLAERAATIDPFFKELRDGPRRAQFFALMRYVPKLDSSRQESLSAFRAVSGHIAIRPTDPRDLLAEILNAVTLTRRERDRLNDSLRLRSAGIPVESVNLLDAVPVRFNELLTGDVVSLQKRCEGAANSLGLPAPTKSTLSDWQRKVSASIR